MWGWWLLLLLPALVIAGGLYALATGRVPPPAGAWGRNVRTNAKATDIRALGWHNIFVGISFLALAVFLAAGRTIGFDDLPWSVLTGLLLVFLVSLVGSVAFARRAFGPPAGRSH
jgi:hypothetical protein